MTHRQMASTSVNTKDEERVSRTVICKTKSTLEIVKCHLTSNTQLLIIFNGRTFRPESLCQVLTRAQTESTLETYKHRIEELHSVCELVED